MIKSIRWKYLALILFTITIILSVMVELRQTAIAKTDLSIDEFKEQLNRVNIDGIAYKDYVALYDINKRVDAEYIIEAEDYVRIEDMEIQKYTDFEGMPGTSVYTGEKGLIEYEVYIEEEGFMTSPSFIIR